jgi:ribosome maturation factor RimP
MGNILMSNVESTLRDRLASLITAMGYEFVGCELQRQGRGSVLRVYIDSEKGITLDDCSAVSHQVSAMLDVDDPIQGYYNLEISSPGLDRPLFEIAQYRKFIGNRIKVRMYNPIDNQRHFVGILQRVDEADIHLLVDTEEVVLPFSGIEKAKVIASRP